MRNFFAILMSVVLILGSVITIAPTLFPPSKAIASSLLSPSYFIEYSNAYGAAIVNVPSIGNITRMLVAPIHQDKSSTIDNYDVMALSLSSPLARGPVQVSISTNPSPTDVSWRRALRNGSSTYTEINGNTTINNLLQVTANELKVQRNGSRLTVDFNPSTPVVVTLPPNLFPSANFSRTWAIPAFHMDFVGYGNLTLGNTTTTNVSGWSEHNEYASRPANATFSCPSWNNYSTTGINATIREFNIHRGKAPPPIITVIPTFPTKTIDAYNGQGSATVGIPNIGNITRMTVSGSHIEQGTMGNPDVITVTLLSPTGNGTTQARISTNPNPDSYVWLKSLVNGTPAYLEVNGTVIINNIFQADPNEVRVQRNGTRLTVDFNPVKPYVMTLDHRVFPPASFPRNWAIPAFHVDFNGYGNLTTVNAATVTPSGWTVNSHYVAYNSTVVFSCPSWNNYRANATSSSFAPYMLQTTRAPSTSTTGWTLVKDAGAVKAYPELREYIWQKNATMPPNGPYDKIGLHRLFKANTELKGVVFVTNCPMWGTGEQRITNPPTDNWTKYENFSQAIYWANRGFDVYAIDYRTHFVPKNLNSSQMSFAASWGWDVWISDIKEAAEKVKEISGSSKFFMSGECTGGQAALNYATKYGSDLVGIILIDTNFPPLASYPIVGTINGSNTYNLTKVLSDMVAARNWTNDAFAGLRVLARYALQNPSAPAVNPNGSALNPPVNPLTNRTWANITEWFSVITYLNFGSNISMPLGMYSNTVGGYGNNSQNIFAFANSEFIPYRIFAETVAMADWVNCPYVTYDYNDHYKEINVPILAFVSQLYSNRTGAFRFVNGTANPDCTGIYLPRYGHIDTFFGIYSARDVSEPAYQWIVSHSPSSWELITTREVKACPGLQEYVWQKNASMAPNGLYDKIGLHRLIKATGTAKGVVFMIPGLYGSGERLVSNPPGDSITKMEDISQCIYWANRGFDVYTIDFRSHFIPVDFNKSQLSFTASWGMDQWVSDIKEAVDKAKEVSGATKLFLSGTSWGGILAQIYAGKYWQQDLQGIVLLDPGPAKSTITKNQNLTNSYDLIAILNTINAGRNWCWENPQQSTAASPLNPGYVFLMQFAAQNPGAPAQYPNGTLITTINPRTNQTWSNITEYFEYQWNSAKQFNTYGGYSNITFCIEMAAQTDRYFPIRQFMERQSMLDYAVWPYGTYDYMAGIDKVNVPVIAFRSGLNVDAYGNITNGMATKDFTTIVLPNYGHGDVFQGTYSARDVSQPALQWMLDHSPSDWNLVTTRGVKGYSDLQETVWQKNPSMAPNGPYDKIGLHRIVKAGITPKGVVFVNPGTYASGERMISPPPSVNESMDENSNQPIYWANRGYDVYCIDYRTHFVPATLNTSQLGFMANWGYNQWISDIREAVLKAKEVSGVSKIFMAGQSFGGRVSMYYAAKYWQEDLKGIILLDGSSAAKYPNSTNTYNLPVALNQNNAAKTWAYIAPNLPGRTPVAPTFQSLAQFAVMYPNAPANVPGTNQSLPPPVNPVTNKTWANITQWMAYILNGPVCDIAKGYGNVSLVLRAMATMDRYWPDRLNLEQNAINDWTNCPYVTFDFDEYFKYIDVPLIGFTSELFGIDRFGGVVGNIANPDVTKITLLKYGHMDVFMGTYSARDVSEPVYQWMINRSEPRGVYVSTAYNMVLFCTSPKLVILDVRNQTEYNTGFISGAILIPVWQLQQRIGELAQYKDASMLVYCETGIRGQSACQILSANGFTDIYNMIGGINAWKSSKYSIGVPK